MSGGINISPVVGVEIGEQVAANVTGTQGPWRPPQWSKPATTSILVPAAYTAGTAPTSSDPSGAVKVGVTAPTLYVFDCVPRIHHASRLVITQHPIQTGANVTDHAYLLPQRLVLEVIMSDAADAYETGMWTGNPSKSVSAYQTLKALQAARIPLTVTTRLETYQNMMVEDVESEDSVRSRNGLRANISLLQIYVAKVATATVSARPQATGSTSLGTTQPTPPTPAIISQYKLPSRLTGVLSPSQLQDSYGTVAGAGNFSSNSTSAIVKGLAH